MSGRVARSTFRTRWTGLACAFAYLLALGWLAPLVTAAVACIDPMHRVQLAQGEAGSRVVLAHKGEAFGHVHEGVTAALVALSDAPDGDEDHVFSFPEGVSAARAPVSHEDSVASPPVARVELSRPSSVEAVFVPPCLPASALLVPKPGFVRAGIVALTC